MDWLIAAGGYGMLALATAFGGGVAFERRRQAKRMDSFKHREKTAAGTGRPGGWKES